MRREWLLAWRLRRYRDSVVFFLVSRLPFPLRYRLLESVGHHEIEHVWKGDNDWDEYRGWSFMGFFYYYDQPPGTEGEGYRL